VTQLFGNAQTRPLSAVLPQTTSTDKFTQELRLVSPKSKSFEWLAGAYLHGRGLAIKQQILAVEAGTDTSPPAFPRWPTSRWTRTYEEFAGFANATWHATPAWISRWAAAPATTRSAHRSSPTASWSGTGPASTT
jgi:hypothetical protein